MSSEANQVKEYCNRALKAYIDNEYDKAIEYCDRSIDLDSCCAIAYNCRGVTKLNKGWYQDALADLNKATFFNKTDPTFYYNRGIVRQVLSDVRCIHDFNLAIALNPNYQSAYIRRGCAKHELELYLEAIDDYNQAIAIDSNNHEAYYHRAATKFEISHTQSALDDLDRAIAIAPQYVYSYTLKAEIFLATNHNEQADLMLKTAYSMDPSEPLIYYINSQLLISEKAYDLAIDRLIQLADIHIARQEFNYYNRTIQEITALKKKIKPS